MANRRRGPAPSWEPRSTPAMLLPLDRLQVPDGLAQPHRDLDLATSALTNVDTDVDDQDLVSHLNLVPMQPREPGKCIVPLKRAHPCKRLIVTDVRAPDAQHHPPGQRLSKPRPVERNQKTGTPAQTHHPWLRTHEANLPTLNTHVRPGPKSTTTGKART